MSWVFFLKNNFQKETYYKRAIDCSSKKGHITMHLTIMYTVNDAEKKNGIIQMYFKSLLKK